MKALQSFEVIWNITLKQPHTIVAIRHSGFWKDKLEIMVDNQLALSANVTQFKLAGHQTISIDGEPVEVHWKWGGLSGSPKLITLTHRGNILASYPQGSGVTLDTTNDDIEITKQIAALSQDPNSLTQLKILEASARYNKKLRSGANWFYAIAVLSIINSIVMWFGGGINFLVGLAFTQLIDGVIYVISTDLGIGENIIVTVIALFFDAFIAFIFVLFGYLARKKHLWPFIVGMVIYGLDALIFIVFSDVLSFGFHILALFGLYSGVRALRQLQRLPEPGVV